MKYISLVGCGFLGSVFATELSKRALAINVGLDWRLIDPDKVDKRNLCNQNFALGDVDKNKAESTLPIVHGYGFEAEAIAERLDDKNSAELLNESDLVVCAVDNQAARDAIWTFASVTSTPTLFVGISEQGTGAVEWCAPTYDTLSLSPLARKPDAVEAPVVKMPPCMLSSMRIHGLNIAHRAAVAASLFIGVDIEQQFGPQKRNEGLMTTWLYDGFGKCSLLSQKELAS